MAACIRMTSLRGTRLNRTKRYAASERARWKRNSHALTERLNAPLRVSKRSLHVIIFCGPDGLDFVGCDGTGAYLAVPERADAPRRQAGILADHLECVFQAATSPLLNKKLDRLVSFVKYIKRA